MIKRYADHYRILGISPGANWNELRNAYKKLINTWHPDHFQSDEELQKLAEDKTKEITQSYKELADYYKKFGHLPLTDRISAAPKKEEAPARPAPDASPGRTNPQPNPSAASSPPIEKRKRPLLYFGIIGLTVIYLGWQFIPHEDSPARPPTEPPSEKMIQKQSGTQHSPGSATNEKYFSVGSRLGEVFAIQGTPTRTDHNTWYYGASKVIFSEGRVIRWEENPDNPLNTNIAMDSNKTTQKFIGNGSSKEEVLAVQGPPDRTEENVWDYGASRVYFENGRVKGWNESHINPLMVRR